MPELRNILGRRDPELWIVTAKQPRQAEEDPLPLYSGMVATSVVSVSIVADMPRVLVAVSNQHLTWSYMRRRGAFALHLLDKSNVDLVWRFGLQTGHNVDKFAELGTQEVAADGDCQFVILPECMAWLGCRIESEFDIGDRSLFVAEVTHGAEFRANESPLSMSQLVEVGDPAKLDELRTQTGTQAAQDRHAIETWRNAHRSA